MEIETLLLPVVRPDQHCLARVVDGDRLGESCGTVAVLAFPLMTAIRICGGQAGEGAL